MTKRKELYKSIVEDIRKKYKGQLNEVEAHSAARNLIEFVKIMLDVHKNQIDLYGEPE